jgi:hypothetical protein
MPRPDNKTHLNWVCEAMLGHSGWRKESWEDAEFKDGVHWNSVDFTKLTGKNINPLTINRIFPLLNKAHGNYIRQRKDIIAKGRTKEDHEISQVMSEAIAFVVDQNQGTTLMRDAYESEISVGFGDIYVGYSSDPRKEKVELRGLPWHSTWWDPYGTPWLKTENCRYAFTAPWTNLDDLVGAFPEHETDLQNQFRQMSDTMSAAYIYDIATEIEDYKNFLTSGRWVNVERRRVRPIEMWYTSVEARWFALFPDGRVLDMDTKPLGEQFMMVQASREILKASVKKMYVTTFLGELVLQDVSTPFPHDDFPFVPYVGYLDRYNFPYGIPRQVKEQNMEVNKRRSMGLALIGSRRTIVEKGAAEDLAVVQDEANRLDSFIIVEKGAIEKIKIDDMAALAAPQISIMQQSEQEIREIAGDEAVNLQEASQSGIALDKKTALNLTMTLNLLENAHQSQKIMGEKIMSLIQESWTEQKVMRVIDRLSGVEKFVEINKKLHDADTGAYTVKNDLTQGRFDLVIATKEITDTMREKNMDLLFSAIQKAPPEAVAPLLNVAFEISDIPEKERILAQIREATGMAPVDENLTMDERKAQQKAEMDKKQAMMAEDRQRQQQQQDLANGETAAKAAKAQADGQAALITANALKQKTDQEGFVAGHEIMAKKQEEKKLKLVGGK